MKLVTLELALAVLATSAALGQGFPGVARPGSDSTDTAPATRKTHHRNTVGTKVYGKDDYTGLKPYEGFRRFARTAGCDSARVEAAIAVADTADFDWRYPVVPVGTEPCTLVLARGYPDERKHITTGAAEAWVWYYYGGSYAYWFRWDGHRWVLTDKVEGG
jgi:hypothetical protein